MAGLTLVKAGKLKLDQKVVDVLPMKPLLKPGKSQPEIDHVTVRMLMNHTSGLFNVVEDLFDRPYYKQLADKGKLQLVHGDISQYDRAPWNGDTVRGQAGGGVQLQRPRVSSAGPDHRGDLGAAAGQIHGLQGSGADEGPARCVPLLPRPERLRSDRRRDGLEDAHLHSQPLFRRQTKACTSWRFQEPVEQLYGNHWGEADACGATMLSAVDLLRFVTFCMDGWARN